MFKLFFKSSFLFIFLLPFQMFCQKTICKCEIVDNKSLEQYNLYCEATYREIADILKDVREDKLTISKEEAFDIIDSKISELKNFSPYYLKEIYDEKIPFNLGFSGWEEEDTGFAYYLYYKKPFNTYIDEQKNFDIMFGVRQPPTSGHKTYPVLVVKNYFTNSEYKTLKSAKLIIDDFEIDFDKTIGGFGNYSEQELALKSGTSIVGYRTVYLHEISISYHHGCNKDPEGYLSRMIAAIKPGKVFITYETSTGQIKRSLSEAQVRSLKETFQIWEKFLFDKFEKKYINNEVKKECERLVIECERLKPNLEQNDKTKEYYPKVLEIENRIKDLRIKYLTPDV